MSVYNKLMANRKIVAYGEMHDVSSSVEVINKALLKSKPVWLLHELLYDDVALDKNTIRKRLSASRVGGVCDPDLNKDIYQFGYDNDIKLVGIDTAKWDDNTPLGVTMIMREEAMVENIKSWLEKILNDRVAIVVGDTHLRAKSSDSLSISPLTEYLKSLGAVIVRADKSIREVEQELGMPYTVYPIASTYESVVRPVQLAVAKSIFENG